MIGHRRFKSVQLSFAIPAHQAVERTRTRVCPATPTRTSQEGHPPPDEVETPRTFLDTSPECLPYAEARSPSGRPHFVLRPFGQKDRDEYGAALRSIKPASGTPIVNDRGCLPSTMPVCTQIARKGTRRLDYVLTRRVPAWTRVQDNRSAASLREDPATNPLRVTR